MKVLKFAPEKCDGSRTCMATCARTFFKTEDQAFSSIVIDTAQGAAPSANFCNQCGECIPICPSRALYRNKTGTVMVKKELCVGCFMCIGFCPSFSMFRAPKLTEPFKCTACGSCVKSCPSGALSIELADHDHLPA